MNIYVINGVNLNMLGVRETNVYGNKSYKDLVKLIKEYGKSEKVKIKVYQSNYEGDIVSYIHKILNKADGIIINPGAFTHYSYAIYDALKMFEKTKVEVHISDIDNREDFRKISVIKDACNIQIKGHGFDGYIEAIKYIIGEYNAKNN